MSARCDQPVLRTNPQFRVIVIGGTGQVGSAVVQALLAESVCREDMVTRKPVVIADPSSTRRCGGSEKRSTCVRGAFIWASSLKTSRAEIPCSYVL